MKRITLFLLVALSATAIGYRHFWKPPREVVTMPIQRGDLELLIRVTGDVINDRTVTLTALVDGQVERVNTTLGERVKAGAILAMMDNRAAAARRKQAQASLKQEAVHRREQQLRYQRQKKLAEKGAVSQERLEDAQLKWEAASAAWEVARAELELAEVAHEWQQIHAPFDAVVVEKNTEKGQWVEAGTRLFSLVAQDHWEIEAHLDAANSGYLKVGQTVMLRCDAFPERVWRSQIDWIGPSVEREKDKWLNTFPVRMPLGTSAPPLLLGQQVDIEILVSHRSQVLKLPFAALLEGEEGFEVAVIEAGKLRYRQVTIGLEADSHVELLSGADEGSQVIRLNGERLKEGMPVTPGKPP
jgi:RND family efflux transporter MFP subunit